MAAGPTPPDFTSWLVSVATDPNSWLKWPARVAVLLIALAIFFQVTGVIDQNWESPGHLVQRLSALVPEVWLRSVAAVIVATIALYLVLLSGWNVAEQRGWLAPPTKASVTTGQRLPPRIRVVTAPRIPELLLRSAARAIYINPSRRASYGLHPSQIDPRGGSEADTPLTLRDPKTNQR
jgi:hypothetical protein